jgi:hypothetical protein
VQLGPTRYFACLEVHLAIIVYSAVRQLRRLAAKEL